MNIADYIVIFIILVIAFVPSIIINIKTDRQSKKGCGRGCSHCGNYNICHGEKKSPEKTANHDKA